MLLSQQVQLVLFLPLLSLYFCREFDTDQSLRKQKISDRFQTLIINGYPSGKSRFFAYIGFSARYKFCGGAVIAKYWVITVALCLYLSDGSIVPGWYPFRVIPTSPEVPNSKNEMRQDNQVVKSFHVLS